MASDSKTTTGKTTTDHEEIRRWAEERGGKPAIVRGTEDDGGGVLRIDFPGGAGTESLEHVSWDEWFRYFEEEARVPLPRGEGQRRGEHLLQVGASERLLVAIANWPRGGDCRLSAQPAEGGLPDPLPQPSR
jgi:hypothetical protein